MSDDAVDWKAPCHCTHTAACHAYGSGECYSDCGCEAFALPMRMLGNGGGRE